MNIIIISGVDGAGKTLIINEISKELRSRGVKHSIFWLRFNHYLARGIHFIGRFCGLVKKEKIGGKIVWRHHFYKSPTISIFYLFAQLVDSVIGLFKFYFKWGLKGFPKYVICDRWIPDCLVDLAYSLKKYDIFTTKYGRILICLLPKKAKIVLIEPNPFVAYYKRYNECTISEIFVKHLLYRELFRSNGWEIIQNKTFVEDCVKKILLGLNI